MKLIVGLGNPGNEYKYTRHNAGFLVIDRICQKLNVTLNKSKFNGEYVKVDDLIIAKPLTYMNLSGTFIQQIADFFKIDSSDIFVIHDEKDIELGRASIKVGGSAGSHNGIKSIITSLNKQDFKRLKVGIKVPFPGELKDFVLGKFSEDEIKVLEKVVDKSAEAAITFGFNDINTIMNKFNSKKVINE
ncbi:aminoacyl-tRNA hydrolase [Mycoplasmopsis edwardii]|uniref:Peptidyl-tRNA hydrolase n=2 Tax=Mycoplasmopsis edwardii TaxID=53558 RepID=A0A3B0QEF0_9BACT|nr:aminoacyl-tRNA hydrolase [Mycoplasmopsis edwardii]WBP84020.1 aminoacyl-tRNA hydrolase [Mycoplasmopsis edwardii]SYV97971.1 Peptidyl-tRNA hydrolase [Mycoplasmopsis edwardii]